MLKSFAVTGMRNFATRTSISFSPSRDYQFGLNNISDQGLISNALLMGRNASGKSNFGVALLDIVTLFPAANVPAGVLDSTLFLNADSGRGLVSFEYRFQFGSDEVAIAYEKSAPRELACEKLTVNGDVIYDFDNERGEFKVDNLSAIGADSANLEFKDPSLSLIAFITGNMPTDKLGCLARLRHFVSGMRLVKLDEARDEHTQASAVAARIIKEGKVDQLSAFLREFGIAEKVITLKEADGSRALYFEHSISCVPFVEGCSSGTRTLLAFFSEFELSSSATFVFLDEFDAYCHFEMAEKLLAYFSQKRECQTLCATHNTALVKNGAMRPDCVFLIKNVGEGKVVTTFADSTDRELRLGNNVEKLYRAGEFL